MKPFIATHMPIEEFMALPEKEAIAGSTVRITGILCLTHGGRIVASKGSSYTYVPTRDASRIATNKELARIRLAAFPEKW